MDNEKFLEITDKVRQIEWTESVLRKLRYSWQVGIGDTGFDEHCKRKFSPVITTETFEITPDSKDDKPRKRTELELLSIEYRKNVIEILEKKLKKLKKEFKAL